MKQTIIILFILFSSLFAFSQGLIKKQILIPLDNNTGVPFYKNEESNDIAIDGFEIDKDENFYFLGGNRVIYLVAFSGNKLLYRKTNKEFAVGTSHLYLFNNILYSFNPLSPNTLLALDPANGRVNNVYENITTKKINSFKFAGNSLITQSFNSSKFVYEKLSLTGGFIKQVSNSYDLPFPVANDFEFLGKWNDEFVFWAITGNNLDGQTFFLISKTGEILKKRSLPSNSMFGADYAENSSEDRKVRNGFLYVLGRNGKFALITKIPLSSLFGM